MKKTLLALAAFAALSTSSMAFGADKPNSIPVRFIGHVMAAPCNLTFGGDLSSINVGTASTAYFDKAGQTLPMQGNATIVLSGCVNDVDGDRYDQAHLKLIGGEALDHATLKDLWAPTSGTAENVGLRVQVSTPQGTKMITPNDDASRTLTTSIEGQTNVVYTFQGQLVSTGVATPGNVALALQAEVTYE